MKLLITGTSGFLGTRIARCYSSKYECLTPGHKELDITDPRCCMAYMNAHKPAYVIHAAAISDVGTCERDQELSWAVNVSGTINLAKACTAAGSRMIFMSSDQVYNGNCTTIPNRESDICHPINVYGRHKLEAEQRMMELLPDAIALRLTWMYDLPTAQLDVKGNFLTKLMDAVEHKNQLSFSDREYRGITYAKVVIDNLEKLFDIPGGVYNYGSHTKMTTYSLALVVLHLLGVAAADDLLKMQEHAVPRCLAMDPQLLDRHQIHFPDNLEGIERCLRDYGKI